MNNEQKSAFSKSAVAATALILAGLVLAVFGYAHRPPEGLMDALQRGDTWAFKPGFYYMLLLVSGLLATLGVVKLIKSDN